MEKFSELLRFFRLPERTGILMRRVDFRANAETLSTICVPPRDFSTFSITSRAGRDNAGKTSITVGIVTSEVQCSIRRILRIRSIIIFFYSDDFIALQCGRRTIKARPNFAINYEYSSVQRPPGCPVSRTCFEYLAICASGFTTPV